MIFPKSIKGKLLCKYIYYNLEWCTPQENNDHAIKHGLTSSVGVDNPRCVLSEIQVIKIRELYDSGTKICKLSEQYPVQKSAIFKIVKRKSWTHL